MLFGKFLNKKNRINGIIGYLGLEEFWLNCSADEQNSLIKYYRSGLGMDSNGSPIAGKISYTSETKLNYLTSMIGWAISDKDYVLFDKLVNEANKISIGEAELVDAHFFYQETAEAYYKQRNTRIEAIDYAIEYCKKDIDLFPQYAPSLVKKLKVMPRIVTFQRLAIIYENQKRYQEAIDLCNLAVRYNLEDSTKGGYSARIEKLNKKLTS